MSKPALTVVRYVLERMGEEPLRQRIVLAEALAEIAPTEKLRAELNEMAAELSAHEERHEQLVLNFKRRARG